MIKLPKTKKDKMNEKDHKYEQRNVHREISYILNKDKCKHICFVSGRYLVSTKVTPHIDFKNTIKRKIISKNVNDKEQPEELLTHQQVFSFKEECITSVLLGASLYTNKISNSLNQFIRFVKGRKDLHYMDPDFQSAYKLFLKKKRGPGLIISSIFMLYHSTTNKFVIHF